MKRKRNDRGFNEIPIRPTGVQKGPAQAPRPPQYVNWAINLAVLSKVHNLYIVASRSSLVLNKPSFPEHHIDHEQSVSLELPKSAQGLRGQLSP